MNSETESQIRFLSFIDPEMQVFHLMSVLCSR